MNIYIYEHHASRASTTRDVLCAEFIAFLSRVDAQTRRKTIHHHTLICIIYSICIYIYSMSVFMFGVTRALMVCFRRKLIRSTQRHVLSLVEMAPCKWSPHHPQYAHLRLRKRMKCICCFNVRSNSL